MPTCNDCEWFKCIIGDFNFGICVLLNDSIYSKTNPICKKYRSKE